MSGNERRPFDSTESYYAEYRPNYSPETIKHICKRFSLTNNSRVLDLGCGTGQITIPLSIHAGEIIGMDPNEAMIEQAKQEANKEDHENISWQVGSDENVTADFPPVDLTTIGRAFHWMNQDRLLNTIKRITEPEGGIALVGDNEWLTKGTQEWQNVVHKLACEYLEGVPERTGPVEKYENPYDELLMKSGFSNVQTWKTNFERKWTIDEIIGYLFSLSFCSAKMFGNEKKSFEEEVEARLQEYDSEPFIQRNTETVISGKV